MQVERGRDVPGEVLATEALNRLRGPTASRWLRAEALVVLGRSQWEQGVFRPAQRSLKSAADLDPFNARAFYYLALVDEDLQRPVEARQAMEQAVKCDPRFPDALYNLGRLRTDAGDARAREAFEQYLEVAPKGVYADDVKRALNPDAAKPTNSPLRKKRRGR
jgi:tetratricopeptide (TPR) repeat protein